MSAIHTPTRTPAPRAQAHTPAPRSGDHAPASRAGVEVGDVVLRAARSFTADPTRACEGDRSCERPGALTLVAEERTTALCGLHAMTVVFSTEGGGPVVLVKPGD